MKRRRPRNGPPAGADPQSPLHQGPISVPKLTGCETDQAEPCMRFGNHLRGTGVADLVLLYPAL
jgi:hypothetical protein